MEQRELILFHFVHFRLLVFKLEVIFGDGLYRCLQFTLTLHYYMEVQWNVKIALQGTQQLHEC